MDRCRLYSRTEVRERLRLSDDVMSFWLKQGLLQASEGGGGKGNHRKFGFWEINIGAILREVRAYGANVDALRRLSDHLREPFLRFPGLAVSERILDLISDVIGQRISYDRDGCVTIAVQDEGTGQYSHAHLSWAEYADRLRSKIPSDELEAALRIAETADLELTAPLLSLMGSLCSAGGDWDDPYFFTRDANGGWSMSHSHTGLSSIAIAIHIAFRDAWASDSEPAL